MVSLINLLCKCINRCSNIKCQSLKFINLQLTTYLHAYSYCSIKQSIYRLCFGNHLDQGWQNRREDLDTKGGHICIQHSCHYKVVRQGFEQQTAIITHGVIQQTHSYVYAFDFYNKILFSQSGMYLTIYRSAKAQEIGTSRLCQHKHQPMFG